MPLAQAAAALLLVCAAATLAPSSARAEAETQASAPKNPPTERVRIRFWNNMFWGPPCDAVHALVEQFNRENPDIQVDILDVPQMEQKIFTAAAGGVAPEVAIFDRFRTAAYAERNAFLPLDDLAARAGIREDEFFATCWGECVYRGKLYSIPFNTDVRVLFYNRASFREAGLDPNRPPRTWKELEEMSRKLTRVSDKGRIERVGFIPASGSPFNVGNTWLYLYGWQKGGEFMSADGTRCTANDPKIVAALEWVTNFINGYGVSELTRFGSGFGIKELDPFLSGKMAMIGEEGFLLSRIRQYKPDLDFGVAPLPWPEDGRHATWSGGFALVMPVGCKYPEQTMKFIRFLTSHDAQAFYGEKAEQIPANESAARTPYFLNDPNWRVFIDEMKYSRYRPVTPAGPVLWDELSRANEFAFMGKMTPKEALDQAQANVQRELDKIAERRATLKKPLIPWGGLALTLGALFLLAVGWRAWSSARQMRQMTVHRKEAMAGYLFALPVIIGLLVFTLGPILASAVFSLSNYEVLTPARWTGMDNYRRLIAGDPRFWTSLWNTVFYTVFSVPLGVAGSLGLALLLNARIVGRSVFRTLFYLPSIVPVVASSMLFLWLFNGEYGLFNAIFTALGFKPLPWLTSEHWAKPSLVLMSLWSIGAGMIIFLAALQGIPRHLYEAAKIDGASAWRQFLHVTLPMLSPAILFMLIINAIAAFQVFTQAYLMTNGQGTPMDSTLFYVFYLFRLGFEYFDMGYASAMAWIMFLLIVGVTALQFRFSRRWVHSEAED